MEKGKNSFSSDTDITFDYYYGQEAEQFAFVRIPKVILEYEMFKKLNPTAKLMYGFKVIYGYAFRSR